VWSLARRAAGRRGSMTSNTKGVVLKWRVLLNIMLHLDAVHDSL